MSGNLKQSKQSNRRIKLAPMAHAVRSALAVSAMALALGTTGNVMAASHQAQQVHTLRVNQGAFDFAPVQDLTTVQQQLFVLGANMGILPTLISQTGAGDISIYNNTPINESNLGVPTTNIYGHSTGGNVEIDNTANGQLYAYSDVGPAINIAAISDTGDATVTNDGSLEAYSSTGAALGIGAVAGGGTATVDNTGAIYAHTQGNGTAVGIAAAGSAGVVITNSGAITAYSFAGNAYGIYASSNGDISVTSSNSIDVDSIVNGAATGIYANSGAGDVTIDNSGTINVYTNDDRAYGIYAIAGAGVVDVTNSNSIDAYSHYDNAIAIAAVGYDGVTVDNSGDLSATSYHGTVAGVVVASDHGDASVTNSGDITLHNGMHAYGNALGIVASSKYAAASVDNSGAITINAEYGNAYGVVATSVDDATIQNSGAINITYAYGAAIGLAGISQTGDVSITNSGAIDIYAYNGSAEAIRGYSLAGAVTVTNSGALTAESYNGDAMGIDASAATMATVTNTADISATSTYGLAEGIFAYGTDASVSNDGAITASGYTFAGGIEAQGANSVAVTNTGDITVSAMYSVAAVDASGYYAGFYLVSPYEAIGIYATGGAGGATVTNSGAISVSASHATGIEVSSLGNTTVTNSGDISVVSTTPDATTPGGLGYYPHYTNLYSTGINAINGGYNGVLTVTNSGNITAVGTVLAVGIDALASGTYGDATVTNSGDIVATNTAKYYGAYGIRTTADGDATVTNSGAITATAYSGGLSNKYMGNAYGIAANAFSGDATVTNSGDITVTGDGLLKYATGVSATSALGYANVSNSGTITATQATGYARAIYTNGQAGSTVTNSGTLNADGKYAYGAKAISLAGDVNVTNAAGGVINATSAGGIALGVFAVTDPGTVSITNAGDITAYGYGVAIGAYSRSLNGDANVSNSGTVTAESPYANAYGLMASAANGTATVDNSGAISVSVYPTAAAPAHGVSAYGMMATGTDVVATNSGTIDATGYAEGFGITATSVAAGGTVNVTNSGDITGTGYVTGAGVVATADGDVTITNSGTIEGVMDPLGLAAAGVVMSSVSGVATLNNATGGVIQASGPDGQAWAVYGSNYLEVINNAGTINGAVYLGAGVDVFNNTTGGLWAIGSSMSSDFGDGDDVINNTGTISFNSGAMTMDLGVNAFNNNTGGVIQNNGASLIDMGYAGVLTNAGTINMVDGATNDGLTIAGDLAGAGALNIDVDLNGGYADQLYVNGNVAATAVQTVNIEIPALPMVQHTTPIVFATVTGDSVGGNFVPGAVLNAAPGNFIDMDMYVTNSIDPTNAVSDTFAVGVDVVGLNDTGTLAASAASGAASILMTQTGTFRQRLGVNPYGDQGKVLSAFVRYYQNSGDVRPDHVALNFGQGGNFNYDQNVWGREVGVNANLFSNFHAGLVFGNADSRQNLTDGGVGQNRFDGTTVGGYVTWYVPGGWYVDASVRKMAADILSYSAAGVISSRSRSTGYSLEGGYEWSFGELNVVPQAQYTHVSVHDVKTFYGTMATFQSHGGSYSQGRLGVELNRTFKVGDMLWTPYGSLNMVRQFSGQSDYTVATNFHGYTNMEGTSGMAEVGMGFQKGGFGASLGLNWMDGGAYDSHVGGQATVRFSW